MTKIRRATLNDLSGIMKLFRRTQASLEEQGNEIWSHGYPNEDIYKEDITNNETYVLVEGGRILGYITIDRDLIGTFFPAEPTEKNVSKLLDDIGYQNEGYATFHRFMVDPAFQGKGYGRLLFTSAMDKHKGEWVLFSVYYKSEAALRLYEKLGFKDFGLYPFKYGGDDEDDCHLIARIS